jgi:hypothetical protein
MATFVYRCPTTGLNVQAWFADDPSQHEGEIYETITCTACTRVHLINRSAGRVMGGDDEWARQRSPRRDNQRAAAEDTVPPEETAAENRAHRHAQIGLIRLRGW